MSGFRVDWVIGPVLGASDLRSQEEFEAFLAEAGVDVDDAPVRYEFIEDRDDRGVLDYRVVLRGEVDVDGTEVEVDAELEFEATESDPDAVAVAADPNAVAAAEAADVAEVGECEPLAFVADGPVFSISTFDGSVVVEGELPPEWRTEIPSGDPCDRTSIDVFTSADARRADFAVRIFPAEGDSTDGFAERHMFDRNLTFDEEGNEGQLQPGDDYYVAWDAPVAVELAGRPAVRLTGIIDFGDGRALTTVELVTVVNDQAVIVYTSYFDGGEAVVDEQLPVLLDGLTISG